MMTQPAVQQTFRGLRLPLGWTFAALAAGLALGMALAGSRAGGPLLEIAGTAGGLWLNALQMTIIPLVAALLVTGTARMIETARAGAMARRTLGTFLAVLAGGTLLAAFAVPVLLQAFPVPAAAADAFAGPAGEAPLVPGLSEFVLSLVSANLFAAAAQGAMLPLVVFFALFGVASARLPHRERDALLGIFHALGNAMLTIVGWILWLAPAGIFALAIGVGERSGSGTFAALGHYVLLVGSLGLVILVVAYPLAVLPGGQRPVAFARAVLPAQAVAVSTQSSLASLPAMLAACRRLGLRESTADFVLPLAVAIFRATSPAMNLAVVIYVAGLSGVALTPAAIATGAAVALVTTIGSVSLPGSISFMASTGPIALAMGVPLEALAVLVAVEMLPDVVRTLGNVTMDVAVTAVVDRGHGPGRAG